MDLPVRDLATLDIAIGRRDYGNYVYMYPPRQAYRQLEESVPDLSQVVLKSINRFPDANAYLHIPFCAQICRFCNLYTTTVSDTSVHSRYVRRMLDEIETYFEMRTSPVDWKTIYFGGGTPSALATEDLAVLATAIRAGTSDDAIPEELATEVSPETVDASYIRELRDVGFDRISIGLQTRSRDELALIGRSYAVDRQLEIVQAVKDARFGNLCLDLIFGLPGQSLSTWKKSLQETINFDPETICAYAWTARPYTGFGKLNSPRPDGNTLQTMFRAADEVLQEAGYRRETHVRWVKRNGGYLQKKYHWGLSTLVGFGAGARSYLDGIDLRSGYSVRNRRSPLNAYLESCGFGWITSPYGYLMNDDEQRRKAVILGLHDFDNKSYEARFGSSVEQDFGVELFEGLWARDLLTVSQGRMSLTDRGMGYRDLIVQLFFSAEARNRTEGFNYDE